MIERVLPTGVSCAEASTDVGEDGLYDSERAAVGNAVAERRAEFATVRYCARRALAGLGVPPGPLLRGERGAPIWPNGIVGSMTHCTNYRAAAVARSAAVRSLGIDAEPHEPLPERVIDVVSNPAERAHLGELAESDGTVHWGRVLFCAKEAVYKTWFPVMRTWLGFDQANITIGPDTFVARLHAGPMIDAGPFGTLHGRWLIQNGIIVTAVVLDA